MPDSPLDLMADTGSMTASMMVYGVVVSFRSRQLDFINMLADKNDATFTQTFVGVMKEAKDRDGSSEMLARSPTKKIRKHVYVPFEILRYIDSLVVKHGLQRSDIVRRLIDGAQARYNAWGKK